MPSSERMTQIGILQREIQETWMKYRQLSYQLEELLREDRTEAQRSSSTFLTEAD